MPIAIEKGERPRQRGLRRKGKYSPVLVMNKATRNKLSKRPAGFINYTKVWRGRLLQPLNQSKILAA